MANVYIALLRAINVGGKNKLPMSALVEEFRAAGCGQVQTYIQSGNVVFSAAKTVAAGIASTMENRIRKRFGLDVPVVVRSAGEMAAAITANPFAKRENFSDTTHVVFCSGNLNMACVAKLDPSRSPGDEFECRGREIYLWLPNGMGKTKLTNAYFDRVLGAVTTARNWRTVLRLSEMTERLP